MWDGYRAEIREYKQLAGRRDTADLRYSVAMTKTSDTVIVGAGHNGLVCAAYLARAGRSVLVLERRETAGGRAVTAKGSKQGVGA